MRIANNETADMYDDDYDNPNSKAYTDLAAALCLSVSTFFQMETSLCNALITNLIY